MKLLTIALFLLLTLAAARAALPLSAGDYSGAWMGTRDRTRGLQGGDVRLNIATNGEAVLFMTFLDPITGSPHISRFDGTVRRNGTVRGKSGSRRFYAVTQGYGNSVRGQWFFSTPQGSVIRLRFYANHD